MGGEGHGGKGRVKDGSSLTVGQPQLPPLPLPPLPPQAATAPEGTPTPRISDDARCAARHVRGGLHRRGGAVPAPRGVGAPKLKDVKCTRKGGVGFQGP
eukprot:366067-Chlamydomonas_euryale.AAC.10